MSKSSEIRDALSALIEDTLPGYVKLPDSIESSDNAVINLDKGYSVGYGPAVNESDIICPNNTRIERAYALVLTNAYVANLDADYRESLEDSLLDDVENLVSQIEINNTLGGLSVNSTYSDDGGIEYLTAGEKQFLVIVLTITVDFFQ